MKKLCTTLVAVLAIVQFSHAQNSPTWPSTGNVGIGTSTPIQLLDVVGSTGSFSTTAKANSLFSQDHTNYRGVFLGYDSGGQIGVIAGSTGGTASNLAFWNHNGTNWFEAMRLTSNGYLGIGTTNAGSPLSVIGYNGGANPGYTATLSSNLGGSSTVGNQVNITNSSNWGLLLGFDGPGVSASTYHNANASYIINVQNGPLNLGTNNSTNMTVLSSGYVGVGTTTPTRLVSLQSSDHNTYMSFNNTGIEKWCFGNEGTASNRFVIYGGATADYRLTILDNGYVGIGTTVPKEALSVNGNIRSKQIKVETLNWPDYVFKKEYTLPSLSEVKNYIDQNQHLPEMPSEAEVAKDGINLGEMVKLQTKKIEELTLYLIEKDKTDKEKDAKLQLLQKQIEQLKQQDEVRITALEKALAKLTPDR